MLMCKGENTFLSKSVGSERGLDGTFVLHNTYPLPSLLRQSQLRPLSVIHCLGSPNEYNCSQSLLNLKERYHHDCMKKDLK